jgi:hypothetical protein
MRHRAESLLSNRQTFLLTLLKTLLSLKQTSATLSTGYAATRQLGGGRTGKHHASLLLSLLKAWLFMDSDPHLNYSELSDDQLRSAIRFAEERIRWVEEDHVTLLRSYRDEVTTVRRHLIDRMLSRMAARGALLSREQYRDVSRAFERRGMSADDIAILVRSATKGRSDRADTLTEIEAMAVLLRLERHTMTRKLSFRACGHE